MRKNIDFIDFLKPNVFVAFSLARARSEAFPFGEGGPRVAVDEVKERYGIEKINLVCQNKHTDKSKFEILVIALLKFL